MIILLSIFSNLSLTCIPRFLHFRQPRTATKNTTRFEKLQNTSLTKRIKVAGQY